MRHALLAALGALALAACGSLAQGPAAAPPPKVANPLAPFGWFAELSGACWRGEYPDKVSSDTQCYLSQYGALMRGTVKGQVTRDGIPLTNFEGDAVFAYDVSSARIFYTQWGTGGTYGTGEITREGDALVFHNFQADGKETSLRSVWRRAGADGFRVARERRGEDGSWKEFLAVDYKRVR